MPKVYAAFALAGVSYKGRNWRDMNCNEVQHFCNDFNGAVGKAVRYVCPVTCGCSDPRQGLYSDIPAEGCPVQCAGNKSGLDNSAVVSGRKSYFQTNLDNTNEALGNGPTYSWTDNIGIEYYQAQYFHNCTDAVPASLETYAANWKSHFERL